MKGIYTFDDNAFVDDVIGTSGPVNPLGGGSVVANITDTSVTTAVIVGNGAYIDLGFTDNVLVNGPGIDLVIFERFGPTLADVTIAIGGMTVSLSGGPVFFEDGGNVNATEIDLDAFGFSLGDVVTDLRIAKPLGGSASPNPTAVAALSTGLEVASFGDATIFKSENDLDPVGLAMVSPAADHLFIGGDGIDNGGFTLATDEPNGVQLGLRANERFVTNFLPNDGVDTYFADAGLSPLGPSDPPGAERATWDFQFHVDLGADLAPLVPSGDVNAPGPLTPRGFVDSVLLDVDFDPAVGVTDFVTVDVFLQAILLGGATNPLLIQDSQNLGFDFWQSVLGAPPFDPFAEGEYTFRLRALNGTVTVASTEIQVVVTTPPEDEDLVVSFGVQGGMPTVETYLGTSVRPENSLNLDTAQLAFVQLPPSEDLDAIHYREESLIFSSTTGVFLKGTQFFPSDLIEFDGFNFNLAFDGSLLGPGENIDAVTELDNGNLLISTATGASLFGFSFDDGDVVEVDLGNSTASLYMGLDEATLFTGTNQNIDALHFDPDTGNLLISVLIGGGTGTIGGLAYDASDNISTDVIELDLSGGVSASILQEGDGLYDGQTRQLDAVYVPEPSVAAALAAGAALVVILSRRRGARRAA